MVRVRVRVRVKVTNRISVKVRDRFRELGLVKTGAWIRVQMRFLYHRYLPGSYGDKRIRDSQRLTILLASSARALIEIEAPQTGQQHHHYLHH